jgi:hypothetical protein
VELCDKFVNRLRQRDGEAGLGSEAEAKTFVIQAFTCPAERPGGLFDVAAGRVQGPDDQRAFEVLERRCGG